ncbi:hypothetical protein RND81_10G065000 [Saponaria officinalis]|uniref:Uncharacterized protein n=1 Tax=Saponaria officinalis TaxID=3572 RepID=A0AAW1HYQ0_SAPOF
MDRVVRGQRKIERDYFTLAALTTNHIKEREKEEMEFGRFGDGFVDNAMEEVIALESNNIDVSPPSSQKNDLKGYILDLASTMKTVAESHIILESKLLKGASLFANNETVKKLRASALRLVNEVIEEQDTKERADLSPVDGTKGGNEFDEFYDDEICNHPSVLAALRLADMVSKNKNPSQISPSQNDKIPYASQKEYVQDYAFCAKRIADDMMALDDKIKLGETIFPNNEAVKKLHSSTTLLYQTYGRHEGEKIQPDFSFDSEDF